MTIAAADTVYGAHNTQTRMASDTADNILWDKYTNPDSASSVTSALSRITFTTERTPTPLKTVIDHVTEETAKLASAGGRTLIVLAGRSRRMAVENLSNELREIVSGMPGSTLGSSVSKTLGDVGAALVATNANASLLVVQASATTATTDS